MPFSRALRSGRRRSATSRTWNPVEREVVPVGRAEYAKAYSLFRRLYEQTKDIAKELS
jgi:xylulokinase